MPIKKNSGLSLIELSVAAAIVTTGMVLWMASHSGLTREQAKIYQRQAINSMHDYVQGTIAPAVNAAFTEAGVCQNALAKLTEKFSNITGSGLELELITAANRDSVVPNDLLTPQITAVTKRCANAPILRRNNINAESSFYFCLVLSVAPQSMGELREVASMRVLLGEFRYSRSELLLGQQLQCGQLTGLTVGRSMAALDYSIHWLTPAGAGQKVSTNSYTNRVILGL